MTQDQDTNPTDDKTQLDHLLDANMDVDQQLNTDMMSEFNQELAQIDSKTIEDVFKGVLDNQLTSPNTSEYKLTINELKKNQ